MYQIFLDTGPIAGLVALLWWLDTDGSGRLRDQFAEAARRDAEMLELMGRKWRREMMAACCSRTGSRTR